MENVIDNIIAFSFDGKHKEIIKSLNFLCHRNIHASYNEQRR
ncbi:hypothetical protein ANACAC_01807 [Anaerostipes caccae L1-92]|uniref:Uncharacterized protein n=1 Tax=Anaerostipes caccae (strain DSM 14662 / CCUG 47493 / JCM 13470 / NCIMB 13811 / L1-92) TaxID=411490 RepID=B0ME14_ANACD|nr:hypothetical protein ANACAC_01807 [Anaerostipes caccae L1-92]